MEEIKTEQKESIKLNKGMNDNYGWEIKLLINEELTEPDKMIVERLEELDKKLKDKFGGVESE